MAVDRLQDRVAGADVPGVLGDDVEVVAVGMQWRDAELGPLLAVVAVVVVGADVRDLLLAERPHQTTRDCGLARRRVADDAEDDWARHRQVPSFSSNTLLARMSAASIVASCSASGIAPSSAAW